MAADIAVSYIVTVFNKEPYIGSTVDSLLSQEGNIPSEYIFVDDVSSDRSLNIIEERTRGIPNVVIVRNSTNAGPSVRVNQGVRLARGKYVQFIDSDDVLAANATVLMLSLIERHKADVVHGEWEKTGMEAAKLVGRRVHDDAAYIVSDTPMDFVFEQRIRRMAQLVRRDTFIASGGCDERVFVQDESLGLRLARAAKRFILFKAPVLLIPEVEGELSRNTAQCNHDRFLASRNMLQDFPTLDETVRRKLYRRCLSAFWKQQRRMRGLAAFATAEFALYVRSKCALLPVDDRMLNQMNAFFGALEGVRHA